MHFPSSCKVKSSPQPERVAHCPCRARRVAPPDRRALMGVAAGLSSCRRRRCAERPEPCCNALTCDGADHAAGEEGQDLPGLEGAGFPVPFAVDKDFPCGGLEECFLPDPGVRRVSIPVRRQPLTRLRHGHGPASAKGIQVLRPLLPGVNDVAPGARGHDADAKALRFGIAHVQG